MTMIHCIYIFLLIVCYLEDSDIGNEEKSSLNILNNNNNNSNKPLFVMGDRVIVISGPMKNITSRIISLDRNIATLKPDPNQVISMNVQVSTFELRKYFRLGENSLP